MKKLLLGLASVAMSLTALAAGNENYSMSYPGDRVETLVGCQGSAQLRKEQGNLYLRISNAKNCSNIKIQEADGDLRKIGKLEGGQGFEDIALNERIGNNRFVVVAESNSGKTSATIEVKSYVAPPPPKTNSINPNTPADFKLSTYLFGRRMAQLADCGGFVQLSKDSSGRAVLTFTNVQKCSNFDILKANGTYSSYKEQKIGSEGNRSESITIPFNQTEFGGNTVKVVVKSNSAKTYDVFNLEFWSL